jgi:hypothetical protein
MALAAADASGGLGSFPSGLLDTLTGGLKLVTAGELAKKYGFSFGADGQITSNANDGFKNAAAPGSAVTFTDQIADAMRNPLVMAVSVARVVTLIIVLVRK